MPKISASTIEEVTNRIDMVQLVGEYTRLERKGADWWGCCPFHGEKTPSFHIIPDRKMYHCFGCGVGGGVINFYMEMEKCSFMDAVKTLAKKAGVEVVYDGDYSESIPQKDTQKDLYIELYTKMAGTYRYFLTSTDAGKLAREYLESRGITDVISEKFQLGYSPADRRFLKQFLRSKNYSDEFLDGSGLFSKKYKDISFFSHRLMFPIFNRSGQVVAFGGRLLEGDGPKYLNSGDLVQYKKGETLFAFHLAKQKIRQSRAVILCEGYMDVIAYHQADIENAVAPLGTALTEPQVKMLRSFVDTIFLSFDSDEAGRKATEKAILLCRKFDLAVKVIQLTGGKDPADIVLNNGAEVLTKYVDSAILDNDYLLSVLSHTYPVDTPEGKKKACIAFFSYIDVLTSDIQRESCFEQLCQTFNLSPSSVRSDFLQRNRRLLTGEINNKVQASPNVVRVIKPTAETRAVLAVIANLDAYPLMRSSLSPDDFDDAVAREMFIALEECYREDAMGYDNLLARCSTELQKFIASAVTSGEFSLNAGQTVDDGIRLVRKNSLLRKRERIMNSIRQMNAITLEEQQSLDTLLNEKMNIDSELNSI